MRGRHSQRTHFANLAQSFHLDAWPCNPTLRHTQLRPNEVLSYSTCINAGSCIFGFCHRQVLQRRPERLGRNSPALAKVDEASRFQPDETSQFQPQSRIKRCKPRRWAETQRCGKKSYGTLLRATSWFNQLQDMDPNRIAALLQPHLAAKAPATGALSPEQLRQISTYIELLQRWNARVNLTAVRDADGIVTRHFGESLLLAAYLFPNPFPGTPTEAPNRQHALDLGSGAGFPGLPLKIYTPGLRLTLVESNHKKAVFLAEVIRALQLTDASVYSGRLEAGAIKGAEHVLPSGIEPPNLVTMRAVERFESALQTAAALVRYGSAQLGTAKLALLVGRNQAEQVPGRIHDFSWEAPILVPQSRERVLLVGRHPAKNVPKE